MQHFFCLFRSMMRLIITLFLSAFMLKGIKAQIKVGDAMPHFELNDQNGELFNSKKVIGKKNLIVYFYPKDDTPGCTKEA